MNAVRKFRDAEGASIWAPPTAAAEVATILGKPAHADDNLPAAAQMNSPSPSAILAAPI